MNKNPKLKEDVLRKMYVDEQLSSVEISRRLGVSNYGVTNALIRFGIPMRNKSEAARLRRAHTWQSDWESLAKEYQEGRNLQYIANKVGCCLATASEHLRMQGVDVRPRGTETPFNPNPRSKIEIDVEKAAELNRNGSTLGEIGRLLGGIAVQVVSKRLKEAGHSVILNKISKDPFRHISHPSKREVARAINATACVICGETRAVDLCHILPRHRGGELIPENTIALCQTHHHCFDRGHLKGPELAKIRHILKKAAENGFTHPHY